MDERKRDLEERLVDFAAAAAAIADLLPSSALGRHARGQIVRAATSPFANYAEARAAESRRDFVHKLRIALKELRETMAWLRFLDRARLRRGADVAAVTRECDELIAIFVVSIRTAQQRR